MQLSRKSLFSGIGAVFLGALLGSGCGGTAGANGNEATAADSLETADQVSALSSVTTASVDPNMVGLTNNTAASTAASGTTAMLKAGCAIQTTVGNVVTYSLNNCTGPYGLVSLTGSLKATYTVVAPGSLQVDLEGQNLKLNSSTLNINSSAVITVVGTARTATVTSTSSATGQRGNQITHMGSYTAGWDPNCVSLTGSFSTRVGLLQTYSTQIANYRRCQDLCPASGVITFSSTSGANTNTTTLTFDGTSTAAITFNGKAGNLSLFCKAN
jgi:hypothetical protein